MSNRTAYNDCACGGRKGRNAVMCMDCYRKANSTRTLTCPDCGGPKSYPATRCRPCGTAYRNLHRKSAVEEHYKLIYDARVGRSRGEHIVVMERYLGRPLLPTENVHHRNGLRRDNRLENLELWTHPQPTGVRVEDLVAWAWTIIERYADFEQPISVERA